MDLSRDIGAESLGAPCARCGSVRLHWTLERVNTAVGQPVRALAWQCLDCDAVWLEPVLLSSGGGADKHTDHQDETA